jgi:hypothetical protein
LIGIIVDRQTRIGHTWRIGEGQVALVHQALGRGDRNFYEAGSAMVLQSVLPQLFFHDFPSQGVPGIR